MQDDHCQGVLGMLAEAIRNLSLERGPSNAVERLLLLLEKKQLSETDLIASERTLLELQS